MTEIKTLAEMPECCAICDLLRHDHDCGERCIENYEDDILDIKWCSMFAPTQWVIRLDVKIVKPKLQER